MPKITKLEVQKKNKERFNLYLDNQFEMGIDIDTLVKFNLKKDQVLEAAEMEQIQKYDHYRRGLNIAIQYLSFRKRTEREVRQHLIKNDISEEALQQVIDYCYQEKLIDHYDYAESLKNTMINTTDKGPETYKQKLYQAGIETNIIDEYTALYIEQQPMEDIIKVASKVIKTKKGPTSKVKQKIMTALMQKGFTIEKIKQAMDELDFSQDEEQLDDMLQTDLEKTYQKHQRKYEGQQLVRKTIETLMRKGYKYDKIKSKLKESGIENGTEEIE
ncbi:recombination regulator RecX [Staphylococcus pasteuri]|uniref:recombination regulator RecX n=1 Tax=Staphylococcus pasteuri TaxID=45972 RepID=UPI003261CC16